MKVRDLIARLALMPQDSDVHGEGCGCVNPVDGVILEKHDQSVLVTVDIGHLRDSRKSPGGTA